MDIRVRLEEDEDGFWTATCPLLPGCISQGKSQEEAIKNVKSAIRLHLKLLAEDGLPISGSKRFKETLVEVHV